MIITKTMIRIGFDLDGVILKNPLKGFRALAKALKFLKPIIFHQKKEPFYFPKSPLEQTLWQWLHKSSYRIDPAIKKLKKLIKAKKVTAYVVSGRYQCLEKDFKRWIKCLKKLNIFSGFYFNKENIQPDKFKEKMIKKLNLDIYVEDNWDIIEKLNSYTSAKIFWLTNFLDQFFISYSYKFRNLDKLIDYLEKLSFNKVR